MNVFYFYSSWNIIACCAIILHNMCLSIVRIIKNEVRNINKAAVLNDVPGKPVGSQQD